MAKLQFFAMLGLLKFNIAGRCCVLYYTRSSLVSIIEPNTSDMLLSRVTDVMSKANKHKISFFEHAYLWTDSRTEFMHYFLTYGRQITPEEMEALVTLLTELDK